MNHHDCREHAVLASGAVPNPATNVEPHVCSVCERSLWLVEATDEWVIPDECNDGLTDSCPNCGGGTTLWGSEAGHGFDHPVTSCEECLIIVDTGA
jgi:hypothetical protein